MNERCICKLEVKGRHRRQSTVESFRCRGEHDQEVYHATERCHGESRSVLLWSHSDEILCSSCWSRTVSLQFGRTEINAAVEYCSFLIFPYLIKNIAGSSRTTLCQQTERNNGKNWFSVFVICWVHFCSASVMSIGLIRDFESWIYND